MKRSEALAIRRLIEKAADRLDDKEASEVVTLFPNYKENGELVSAGTRIKWNGKIKKAAVDLWATELNNPDNAPALWQDIMYRDGIKIIPVVITAVDTFALDEIGWWGDEKYRSKRDGNVHTPEQYPDGWELVAE